MDNSPPKRSGDTGPLLAVYTDLDGVDFTAGADLLRRAGFVVQHFDTTAPERIVASAAGAAALLVGNADISSEMMDRLPALSIISLLSVGHDNVDVEAARVRGIWVANTPGTATEEVATHALALTLALLRQLPFYLGTVDAGRWRDRAALLPPRLSDLRLGVVGLGRIGTKFAQLAKPLFADVVGAARNLPNPVGDELAHAGVRIANLAEVRRTADVLSLHVPMTAQTAGLVDAAFLAAMPRGAYLINVSRGGLLDSTAVRAAVDSGHLAGVAVDVLDEEPPCSGHPLLNHPRIVVTPHVAYLSDAANEAYVLRQAENVIAWRTSGRPNTPVIDLV